MWIYLLASLPIPLSKVEQCYATITKEAFAIFHCFKKWYTIIDYCPVCIMMDARSLTLILRGRTHNNMLDQMSLMITPYHPKITWLKGMDNKVLRYDIQNANGD